MAAPPRTTNAAGLSAGKWAMFAVLVFVSLAAYGIYIGGHDDGVPECVTRIGEVEVRGDSLSPLISSGQTLKLMYGYYDCRAVERDDIVVYNYSGHAVPIVKIAKGVEGDSFHMEESSDGCGWNIIVNGEVLENSQGIPYCADESGRRMLYMYERDYRGVIPDGACLLLGDMAGGSLDSTHFGFVGRSDLVGKAVE